MYIKAIDHVISDTRGTITQVISTGIWRQLNIIERTASSVGGGHYHKKTVEHFYVLEGRVLVVVRSTSDNTEQRQVFGSKGCFTIRPYEQHYMRFLARTILCVLYSVAFNKEHPDIFVDKTLPSLDEMFSDVRLGGHQ